MSEYLHIKGQRAIKNSFDVLRKISMTLNQGYLSIILQWKDGHLNLANILARSADDQCNANIPWVYRLCCGNIFPCLQNTNCQPGADSPDLLSSDVRNINQINLFLYISGYLYPFMFYQSPFHTNIYFALCGLRIQFLYREESKFWGWNSIYPVLSQ